MPSRRRNQVDPLQLRPGDFVVHEQHGVGRFVEMMQRTVARRHPRVPRHRVRRRASAASRGDRLFVPDRPARPGHPLRRRRGARPSTSWAAPTGPRPRAGPARRSSRSPAELIRLYSRPAWPPTGHAFGPDTPWQRELEDAFPYVETPDQLTTIDEVKADMERPVPMDRLVCGDVGYGKTEIAVRAAFKAVQDGKQVAVLVPTTLLVQQHLQTFTERYAQLPGRGQGAVAVPDRQGGQGGRRRAWPTARSTRHRHPPPALRRDRVQGPRPGRRRRGAALRRRAQGAAQDGCAPPSTCWR